MTKNKLAYALIAVLAIGVTSASIAVAEPVKDKMFHFGVSSAGVQVGGPELDITGSINVGKDIFAKAKVDFAEAAAIAETQNNGRVTSGNLGVQNGYLVYSFTVVSEDEMRTILVDAGDGKVIFTSEPMPADIMAFLMPGPGMMFVKTAPLMDLPDPEEQ